MRRWHEPFTWKTISEVLPEANDEQKDIIYQIIMAKPSWTISMIEEIWETIK